MIDTPDTTKAQTDTSSAWMGDFDPQAEYRARSQELLPGNKEALFDALAAARIIRVTANFDGCGGSGQVEDIAAYCGDETASLPDVTIEIAFPCWGDCWFISGEWTLAEAIEDMASDLLSASHPGWEDNDGAYGAFAFDVAARSITLDFNRPCADPEHFRHEF